MTNEKIKSLKQYFKERPEVVMAFVFGSQAKGLAGKESDFDVAVYLKNQEAEDKVWSDVTRIVEREVDLINLAQAPATLISSIFKTGIPLVVKNKRLYWDLYLKASAEAEDFAEFAKDFWSIYKRSKSLIPESETRLLERVEFLETELKELDEFKKLTFEEYKQDKAKRRNIEKWVENICNATLDIAKIILASEKKRMPRTYKETLLDFGVMVGFTEEEARKFSKFANLRNLLAHEYLDILWGRIQFFLKEFLGFYQKVSPFLDLYLQKESKN